MATKYFINGGVNNNYTDNTNWSTTSGGANDTTAPTISDDVRLDGASPNCVLNASGNALTFVCTGYTNTLSGSANLNVAGNVTFGAGMTITVTGTLTISASATITSNAVTWSGNMDFSTTTPTYTITGDLTITGTFSQTSGSNITFNGSDIICNGSVSVHLTSTRITGTTDFIFAGTGTWSGGQSFACNVTITGTYTLSGTVSITGTCVFTCTTGTLTVTGSTFNVSNNTTANVVINTNQTLNNLSFNTSTCTLSQAIILLGTLTYINNATITINGFSITVPINLTLATNTLAVGTTNIILSGIGTWSGGTLRNNLTINTSSTITLGSAVGYNTGILTRTSGTVDTTTNNSTLTIAASTTLNTNGITWNNVIISAAATITNNSLLTINRTLTLPNANVTFAGTHGFTCGILTHATLTAARTYTLVSTKTYTITGAFTSNTNTNSFRPTFRSSVAASQAILTLQASASQDLKFVNATDIDSSLGQTINSNKGTLSNATNWYRTNGTFMYLIQN